MYVLVTYCNNRFVDLDMIFFDTYLDIIKDTQKSKVELKILGFSFPKVSNRID